jgi:hypothetical protein
MVSEAGYLELWKLLPDQEDCDGTESKKGELSPQIPADLVRRYACLDPLSPTCRRPRLGVALEGGGTKSASFALGVLAGMDQSGLLNQVDVISSTSGGSYAAYYYFAHLMDAYAASVPEHKWVSSSAAEKTLRTRDQWFSSCVPAALAKWLEETWQAGPDDIPKDLVCGGGLGNENTDREAIRYFSENYPDLFHLLAAENMFALSPNLDANPSAFKRPEFSTTWSELATEFTVYFIPFQIVSIPLQFITNGVFNWHWSHDPSAYAYRNGMERAYAFPPAKWIEETACSSISCGRPWDLSDLGRVYRSADKFQKPSELGKFPVWIINATSDEGTYWNQWGRVPIRDALRLGFELTPFGQGSGLFGYVAEPAGLNLRDAVGASAAFLDPDQKAEGYKASRYAINLGLYVTNVNWGISIENRGVEDSVRDLNSVTPWPLYLNLDQMNRDGPYIHLMDGGNVDNDGLMPLLRRGVQNIVVASGTEDTAGSFRGLCIIKNELELDGVYRMDIDLPGFDLLCNRHILDAETRTWDKKDLGSESRGDKVWDLVCERLTRSGIPESECDSRYRLLVRANQTNSNADKLYTNDPLMASVLGVGFDMQNFPFRDGNPIIRGCVYRATNNHGDPKSCVYVSQNDMISRLFIVKASLQRSLAEDYREVLSCELPNRCSIPAATEGRGKRSNTCTPDNSVLGHARTALSCGPPGGNTVAASADGRANRDRTSVSCIALAFAGSDRNTEFPQESFAEMTLHDTHFRYLAYFDLGRSYATRLPAELCSQGGAP